MRTADVTRGPRAVLGRIGRAPALRLFGLGAALLLAVRLWPLVSWADAARPAGPSLAALDGAAAQPVTSDDDVLYRTGSAAVAADDPVVQARLARLARYVELGGTAEETEADLARSASDVGLARDAVLRRYLIEVTRLALEQPAPEDLADEAALHTYYERHADRFTAPARVRATQIYLGRARHGAALEADAARLLARLRASATPPAAAATLGDPFVRGPALDGARDAIARGFGAGFARALDALPTGSWQGPIASPYGLHLVWIEERTPAAREPFEQVRGRVVHAFLHERGVERARARLAALRCHYGLSKDCPEHAPGA